MGAKSVNEQTYRMALSFDLAAGTAAIFARSELGQWVATPENRKRLNASLPDIARTARKRARSLFMSVLAPNLSGSHNEPAERSFCKATPGM